MCSLKSLCGDVLENCGKKCAVVYWDDQNVCKTLCYEDVKQTSSNLTNTIRGIIIEKYQCVGLYMEHNCFIPSLVISLQKCDLAFIFLDPYASNEVNSNIIKELHIKWIISFTQEGYNINVLSPFSLEADLLGNNLLKLWKTSEVTGDSNLFETICYVVCTSGTTGKPKIVKVQTECIASNVCCLRTKFELAEEDVIYFGTPLTFDPSMIELFLGLTTGASLLIAPQKEKINPARLLNVLFPKDKSIYKGVTVLQMVPSLFLRWTHVDIDFILQASTCRILAFGGEMFPEKVLFLKRSECLKMFNLYGITEVSCWASVCEITKDTKEVSLGKPLDDTILEIRDSTGSAITNGEGELYIGSFTRICYVNDENQSVLMKPIFRSTGDYVRVNSTGVFYICRNNSTIKRLGHKVNLSQVEEAIFKQTNISNVCIWLEDKSKLVLFLAVKEYNVVTKEKIIDKLRVKLLHSIPKQCFPDDIEIISNFPLTNHGKVDRQALEDIYNKIKNTSSKNAADLFEFLWSKYSALSFSEIGKYYTYNFFEVGGNSVSAIQCMSEFQDGVETDFPNTLTTLLFEKTLGECIDFIKKFKVVPGTKRKLNCEIYDNIKTTKIRMESNIKINICWKYDLEACVDSSPILVKERNLTMVAIGSFSHIFAIINSENGNIVSQVVLPDAVESACCASPSNDRVFTGCYDGKMYAIEVSTGKIVWEYRTADRIKSTPSICLKNNALVFGSYDKYVHCVNIEDGTLIWKSLLSESITSNVIVHKEKIYVATIFGTCFCLSEASGNVLWRHNVGPPIFGSACICNSTTDSIVWPDVSGILHSFSCENGDKEWTFKANGNIYSSLRKYGNFILFGCHDHNVFCVELNGKTCSLKYRVQLEYAISSTPCVMQFKEDIYVIAADNGGNIFVIELNSGEVIQNVQLPGEVFASPVIENNSIYIGCRDNNLYCLNVVNNDLNK